MTSYSKRQLKTPRLARDVYMVTAGASAEGGEAGCERAVEAAADAIEVSLQTLSRFVQSCCYVPPEGGVSGSVHRKLGLTPLGTVDSARGGPALWTAAAAVASGLCDTALVAAWDGHGAHCVVVADCETAQTLSKSPVRLGVAIAHGVSSALDGADLARTRALAMAGADSAAPADDLAAGHPRIVQLRQRALDGSASMLVLQGDDDRTTVIVMNKAG